MCECVSDIVGNANIAFNINWYAHKHASTMNGPWQKLTVVALCGKIFIVYKYLLRFLSKMFTLIKYKIRLFLAKIHRSTFN